MSDPTEGVPEGGVALSSARGRGVLAASVVASGVALLDGTVVNAALPAIGRDFHVGLTSLQWVVDAYLLTLGSLLILGGSLGDLLGRRRVFVIGLVAFSGASAMCGLAPNAITLEIARAVQGIGGALLVPGSLALLSASISAEDRSRAIGAWSGLSGVWTAVGPFAGGWLISAASWRWVFLLNLPLTVAAVVLALRFVPESRDSSAGRGDVAGAVAVSVGLGGVVVALIEGPANGWAGLPGAAGVIGAAALGAFMLIERRERSPMVPLEMFAVRQFSGANVVTFAMYSALGVTTFLLVINLQRDLGYSPLEAGAALLPLTVMMLVGSARSAALAQRIGPRLQMTVGPLSVAAGLALLSRLRPGDHYMSAVLPGAIVFGVGLTATVAPLTAAVLAAVEERHLGVGSAINNAVARVAGLIAIAVVPSLAGVPSAASASAASWSRAAGRGLAIAACLAAAAGVAAAFTISRVARPDHRRPHHVDRGVLDCRPMPSAMRAVPDPSIKGSGAR